MSWYRYEALTPDGTKINDEGSFTSPAELYHQLKEQNYTLISYRKNFFHLSSAFPIRIKRQVLAEFFRNLAVVLRAGVPLVEALEDLAQSPGDPRLKLITKDVIKKIRTGELFSKALSHHAYAFPNIVIVLARLGEETGKLDMTLTDAANHLERVQEIIDKTKRALSYPVVILTAMMGALAFWLIYVLPKLFELFKSLGLKELPLMTRILFSVVETVKAYWFMVPMLILCMLTFGFVAHRNQQIRLLWDRLWSAVPLIGRVIKASQLAFFFEYLSLLTSSGIDVIRSLDIMEGAITHQILKKDIIKIKELVMAGYSLSESFRECSFFEPFILRMVRVGENTGNMPEQLKILADFYMERVNRLVDSMAKTLEPVLIIFAGIIFVVIVMGLLGPIYDMMGSLK
ncbi:MAG: hypothetical protein DSZ23_05775 [Thermodesulfatator sp.]|nr:MAG: hypothetical protein DSZ23_05775 [Thermodesulfatator sp.]